MRFGLNLPNFGEFADVRVVADIAATAEANGWDGFFTWDHLSPVFAPGMLVPTADVTVSLTAIALATSRMQFGTLVTPLPRRRVQKVAREFATLDRLSGGRVVLGAGLGEPPDAEYAAFGDDPGLRARARRLDESLDVLTQLWTGAPVDYDGELVRVHTAPLIPTPLQQPRIPVWIAATWPGRAGPIRRAQQWDGVFPIPPDPLATFITPEDIRAVRAKVGRTDPEYQVLANGGPDSDPADFANAGATWFIETVFTRDEALDLVETGPPR